jgi:phospholipase A-2-activating protein
MQDKINELSGRYQAEIVRLSVFHSEHEYNSAQSMSHLAIYHDEKRRFDELFTFLSTIIDGRSTAGLPQPAQVHLDTITAVLDRWPLDNRWPLLDLGRLVAAWCPTAFSTSPRAQFLATLRKAAEWSGPWEALSPQRSTNVGLVLRASANALIGASPADAEDVLASLEQVPYVALNKATRVVYATILFKSVF